MGECAGPIRDSVATSRLPGYPGLPGPGGALDLSPLDSFKDACPLPGPMFLEFFFLQRQMLPPALSRATLQAERFPQAGHFGGSFQHVQQTLGTQWDPTCPPYLRVLLTGASGSSWGASMGATMLLGMTSSRAPFQKQAVLRAMEATLLTILVEGNVITA